MSSSPVTLDFGKAQPIDFSKYAEPSKLDMSTYQPLHVVSSQPIKQSGGQGLSIVSSEPIQNPNGVTLDFSKAVPIPQGASVGQPTTPPNSFSGQWNPQSQQWEDAEPNTVATQGPTERFARSFNKGVTGAEDPKGFIDNLKQMASQTASDVADEISNHPVQAIAGPAMGATGIPGSQRILQGIYDGMKQTWGRAAEELKNGNITSKEGLLNYVNGLIHATEGGIPIAGPMLSDADKELGAGNVAGAMGTVSSLAAPALMGAEGGNLEADTGTITNPGSTPPSSSGGLRSTAAKYARSAADFVDPDFTGLVSPRLAHAQRLMGKVANALEEQPQPISAPAPGPTTVQLPEGSWSGSVRNPAPVEGQPGAQIATSTAARTAVPPAQVAQQTTAGAIAPASEDEIAQGLGYKNAIQAQQHVGPDAWRQTYQKSRRMTLPSARPPRQRRKQLP
jgi:hypothetical protein